MYLKCLKSDDNNNMETMTRKTKFQRVPSNKLRILENHPVGHEPAKSNATPLITPQHPHPRGAASESLQLAGSPRPQVRTLPICKLQKPKLKKWQSNSSSPSPSSSNTSSLVPRKAKKFALVAFVRIAKRVYARRLVAEAPLVQLKSPNRLGDAQLRRGPTARFLIFR